MFRIRAVDIIKIDSFIHFVDIRSIANLLIDCRYRNSGTRHNIGSISINNCRYRRYRQCWTREDFIVLLMISLILVDISNSYRLLIVHIDDIDTLEQRKTGKFEIVLLKKTFVDMDYRLSISTWLNSGKPGLFQTCSKHRIDIEVFFFKLQNML